MHQPVLLQETIEGLSFKKGDVFLDATINRGGHSREVGRNFGKEVKIIGFDLDTSALAEAEKNLRGFNATLVNENFRNLDKALDKLQIKKIDKALFDLGLSMQELRESGRGFSFNKDEPLLMTFSKNPGQDEISAKDILNSWSEELISKILHSFSDEKYARQISRKIVEVRRRKKFETTYDLVEAVKEATPYGYQRGRIHFATKTFQALRMAVNDELGALGEGMEKAFKRLSEDGRMAVITFHSVEDRAVKRFFIEKVKDKKARFVGPKFIKPTREEIKENPASRSAKLRILEKI